MSHRRGRISWLVVLCVLLIAGTAPAGAEARERVGPGSPVIAGDPTDTDVDGIPDSVDNCPDVSNGLQEDWNADDEGDACDDTDADGALDDIDNCREAINPGQENWNADDEGDACDESDADGILDDIDNCPSVINGFQEDADADGLGDACDVKTQPDARIGLKATGPFTGIDVYGSTVVPAMTVSRTGVKAGTTARYTAVVGHDGWGTALRYRLKGVVSGTRSMKVTYLVAGVDRTAAIAAGTYRTPSLAPGASITIVIRVTVAAGTPMGASRTVTLRATSPVDAMAVDVVRAVTTR